MYVHQEPITWCPLTWHRNMAYTFLTVSMWGGPYQLWQNPDPPSPPQKKTSYFKTIAYWRLTEIGFSFQLTCINLSSSLLPLRILALRENKNTKNTQTKVLNQVVKKSLSYTKDELSPSLVAIDGLVNMTNAATDSHSVTWNPGLLVLLTNK